MAKRTRRLKLSAGGGIVVLLLALIAFEVASRRPAEAPPRRETVVAPLPWRTPRPNPRIPGDILIADSYNHRILIVNADRQIVWQFPKPGVPPNRPFLRPDDGFFGPHFDEIITNEEDYQVVSIIRIATRRVVWEYGHFGHAGAGPGYLDYPDDAFLYDRAGHGLVTVADIRNDRILLIDRTSHRIVHQWGETGVNVNAPPVTYSLPNGDFPAPDRGMLVTQIGAEDAVRLNARGQVLWSTPLPAYYPSDANLTPHGNIIVAFYTNPGRIVKVNRRGRILWQYDVTQGPGALNHPSLAVELPNGLVLATDDYNDRVVIIDPHTDRIIWQYGHRGVPGRRPGYLNIPDGADWLPAGAVPGGKNPIGRHLWSYSGNGY